MKKNGFLTFISSFIPGAGQMYYGYMKRGLSLLIIFTIFIILAVILSTPIFVIIGIIVVIYSFFDTWNIRNIIETENKPIDEYIWGETSLDNTIEDILSKRSFFLGIALLIIGIFVLFNNIILSIAYSTDNVWLIDLISNVKHYLPSFLLAGLTIGIGIKLMFNKKN